MGIFSRVGSIATAVTTVAVTSTVLMQPAMDSQDSFLKDGINSSGAIANVPINIAVECAPMPSTPEQTLSSGPAAAKENNLQVLVSLAVSTPRSLAQSREKGDKQLKTFAKQQM